MTIQSIQTKHVTEQPYASLFAPESLDDFEPYHSTTIRYTDPRPGERADRVYNVSGQGATEYESEQNALENLRATMALKATTAYEKFLADNGAGMLEIA